MMVVTGLTDSAVINSILLLKKSLIREAFFLNGFSFNFVPE